MTIEQVFNEIAEHPKREALMKSFDKCEAYFLEYKTGFFIACHWSDFVGWELTEQTEFWATGRRKENV